VLEFVLDQTGVFSGFGDVPIAYAWAIPSNAHSAVLIMNGRVETYLKYQEVMAELYASGFAVFTLDHRGQGLSGRMLQETQKGFVDSFDDYVTDVLTFVEQVVEKKWDGRLFALCHSMGGAIGALTMLAAPKLFQKAVLCSPMFGIKPALPSWLSSWLLGAGRYKTKLKKQQADYFFGQRAYLAHPFAFNRLTHSEPRYQAMVTLYANQPDLRLGGVTTEWLAAALAAMDKIEKEARLISTPTLVFSSGKDLIIDNKRQESVARQFQQAEYVLVNGAYHELLCEADEYRNPVIKQTIEFLLK
jgi:lysophospholipase